MLVKNSLHREGVPEYNNLIKRLNVLKNVRLRLRLHWSKGFQIHECFLIHHIQGIWVRKAFIVGIQIQCFHFKFRIENFADSWRNRKVLIPNSCFVCKQQNESRTKCSRIRDERGNICSSVNVVLYTYQFVTPTSPRPPPGHTTGI